jgi:hypothetical protein
MATVEYLYFVYEKNYKPFFCYFLPPSASGRIYTLYLKFMSLVLHVHSLVNDVAYAKNESIFALLTHA